MTISAKIIADSISPAGIRLTTMQLVYPRMVHSEFMTHRLFSRNASSSRAIPVAKMIEAVKKDPAMPVFWGKNQPGMQAAEEVEDKGLAVNLWLRARDNAVRQAEGLLELGLHKQIANRILEPWQHIHVVVSATDYDNFFHLRLDKDAQPEIQALAKEMWIAREQSVPKLLQYQQWHLPYIRPEEMLAEYGLEALRRVSAARCARVSYLKHDGEQPDFGEDLALFDRLAGRHPIHASPLEHQATPDIFSWGHWTNPHLHGNFTGWVQYRKTIHGERFVGKLNPNLEKAVA